MITADHERRIQALRRTLFRGINDCLRKDSHHKSSEGHVTISRLYPNYFASGDGDLPSWKVTVWCYLLVPDGRERTWSGMSLDEALTKAEDDVSEWCTYAALDAMTADEPADDSAPVREDIFDSDTAPL